MQNWEAMEQTAYNHNWFSNMIAKRTAESPKSPTITSDFNPFMMGNKFHPIDMTSSASTFLRSDGADNKPAGYYDNQPNIIHNSIGFNPLTPPGYPNPIIPRINFNHDIIKNESTNNSNVEKKTSTTPPPTTITPKVEPTDPLTPSHTPPLDNISSTKFRNETPEHTDNSSSCNEFGEEMQFSEPEQDDSIRTPKFNSHGKVKQFKCKQCGFVAFTKVEFWEHNKVHMKPEKALQCKLCPFVTELKHHLEYHIRKHNNLKPFNCNRCSYTCVNKSMLNSHLKSHSEVFQFNCADCNYATKYCHSFKMHLRKHSHKPGVCLNEDGSPNPDMIIDVYGTRRGPKMKSANRLNHNRAKNLIKNERKFLISQQQKQEQEKQQQQQQEQQQQQQQQKQEEELQQRLQQQQQQQHHQQLLSGLQQMIPQPLSSPLLSMPSPLTSLTCPLLPFDNPQSQAMMTALTGIIPYINDWNLSILATHAILARLPLNLRRAALKALCTIVNNEYDFNEDTTESECDEKVEDDKTEPIENVVMDLSQPTELEQPPQFGTPPSVNTVKPNRRKGRAFKL